MSQEKKPETLQITFIGGAGVGKGAIVNKFTETSFVEGELTHSLQSVARPNGNQLNIVQTPGSDANAPLIDSMYNRRTNAFVFVIDGTNPTIPEHIKERLKKAKKDARDAKFYVVINKVDAIDENARNTIDEQINTLVAEEPELDFLREAPRSFCSDKTGEGINELFEKIEKDLNEPAELKKRSGILGKNPKKPPGISRDLPLQKAKAELEDKSLLFTKMSIITGIIGALVGAFIGFGIGGPIGAIIGACAGAVVGASPKGASFYYDYKARSLSAKIPDDPPTEIGADVRKGQQQVRHEVDPKVDPEPLNEIKQENKKPPTPPTPTGGTSNKINL